MHFNKSEEISQTHREPRQDPAHPPPQCQAMDSDPRKGPPELDERALYGLAGQLIRAIAPRTEAHPAAMLINLLLGIGNIVGSTAHVAMGADNQRAHDFAVLIGPTSKGRKGTSWACIKPILKALDEPWSTKNIHRGLVSGEGLIYHVRNPRWEAKDVKEGEEPSRKLVEEGVLDKRMLVIEEEFAQAIKAMNRKENTLNPTLRQAWDGNDLQTMAKNSPLHATAPHIALIGHITKGEALKLLQEVDAQNGFLNRFLWIYTDRTGFLSRAQPVRVEHYTVLIKQLAQNLNRGRARSEIPLSIEAWKWWDEKYTEISEAEPGLYGAITARGEAHIPRLALIFALIENASEIGVDHFEAAMAIWRYSCETVKWSFGAAFPNPIANRLYEALKTNQNGLSRTEISELFKRHRTKEEIDEALGILAKSDVATRVQSDTAGRPVERWVLTNLAKKAK